MRIPIIPRDQSPMRADAGEHGRGHTAQIEVKSLPLLGLLAKGTILTFLTLGLYRFWLKTNIRRYYWSITTLLGDSLEYTGTGKELLIGFLKTIFLFFILNIIVTVLGYIFIDWVLAIQWGFSFLFLPALFQFLAFRARRYRLARTRWRGVRFAQHGAFWRFFWINSRWLALSIVSLGLFHPFFQVETQRYYINNTAFGQQQAEFSETFSARSLMCPWFGFWVLGMLSFGLFVVALINADFYALIANEIGEIFGDAAPLLRLGLPARLIGLLAALSALFSFVFLVAYRAKRFRGIAWATRFGAITLSSDLATSQLMWVYLGAFLGFLAYVITAPLFIAAAVLLPITILKRIPGVQSAGFFGIEGGFALISQPLLFGLGALIFLVGFSFMSHFLLLRPLWRAQAQSITLTNLGALSGILQAEAQSESAFGDAVDSGVDFAG